MRLMLATLVTRELHELTRLGSFRKNAASALARTRRAPWKGVATVLLVELDAGGP